MGRNALPIAILAARGKKHLTKQEIEHRKKSEIKLGETKLKCPDFVKSDVNAFAKWKEVCKIYKDTELVSSGDVGLVARYCMTFSEYKELLEHRKRVAQFNADWSEYESLLPEEFIDSMNQYMRLNIDLQLDSAINKKMDMLIKMEDRLFLNPLAKIKNVPKKEKERKDPNADLFD
jgi:phage terminase small subunit